MITRNIYIGTASFLSYAEKILTNSLTFTLDWLSKASRQAVIFIYRQRTN